MDDRFYVRGDYHPDRRPLYRVSDREYDRWNTHPKMPAPLTSKKATEKLCTRMNEDWRVFLESNAPQPRGQHALAAIDRLG